MSAATEGHGFKELAEKFPKLQIPKGRGRLIMLEMAERIEAETGDGPWPEPKNPIYRGIYNWLKKCATGDKDYIKELFDRLDGKPAQAVALTDADGQNLPLAKVVRQIIDPQAPQQSQPDHPTLQ